MSFVNSCLWNCAHVWMVWIRWSNNIRWWHCDVSQRRRWSFVASRSDITSAEIVFQIRHMIVFILVVVCLHDHFDVAVVDRMRTIDEASFWGVGFTSCVVITCWDRALWRRITFAHPLIWVLTKIVISKSHYVWTFETLFLLPAWLQSFVCACVYVLMHCVWFKLLCILHRVN